MSQELKSSPSPFEIFYIGMNANKPPFDDGKVRQGFNYAVDRETVAGNPYQLIPASGFLPPGFPGYNEDLEVYDFDLIRAQRLLEESRYGDNIFEEFPLIRLNYLSSFSSRCCPGLDKITLFWGENFLNDLEMASTEYGTYLQGVREGRFQLFAGLVWSPEYPDPYYFLDASFHSQGSDNLLGYANPVVDRLLEQARIEMNQGTRGPRRYISTIRGQLRSVDPDWRTYPVLLPLDASPAEAPA